MRVEVLSRKQIVDDFSHGIRRRLTHIRCARCGNGVYSPMDECECESIKPGIVVVPLASMVWSAL